MQPKYEYHKDQSCLARTWTSSLAWRSYDCQKQRSCLSSQGAVVKIWFPEARRWPPERAVGSGRHGKAPQVEVALHSFPVSEQAGEKGPQPLPRSRSGRRERQHPCRRRESAGAIGWSTHQRRCQDDPPQEGDGHNIPEQGGASSGQGGNQFSDCPTVIVWHKVCQEGQGPYWPGQRNEGVSPHQARHQVTFSWGPPQAGEASSEAATVRVRGVTSCSRALV